MPTSPATQASARFIVRSLASTGGLWRRGGSCAAAAACYPSRGFLPRLATPFPGVRLPARPTQTEGRRTGNAVIDYEILLLLDPELAEEKQGEVDRARARAGREGRRHVRPPRRVGQAQARLRDRQEGRRLYHLLTSPSAPETLDEISRVLKIDDDVMRHMATRRPEGGPSEPLAVGAPDERRCGDAADARGGGGVMAANINRVVLVGNLTRDPELRHTAVRHRLCSLRLAVNTRRKDESGQWADKPNYFDVTVWGNQGESCAQYLSKGRPVGDRRPPRVARVGGARTAPSARRSRSSPTTSSSSAAAATARAVAAAAVRAGRERAAAAAPTSRPPPTDDDIPF